MKDEEVHLQARMLSANGSTTDSAALDRVSLRLAGVGLTADAGQLASRLTLVSKPRRTLDLCPHV